MAESFRQDGYTVTETPTGLDFQYDDGDVLSAELPGYSAFEDFDAPSFHGYVVSDNVGSVASLPENIVFNELLREPGPLLERLPSPVTNGQTVQVTGLIQVLGLATGNPFLARTAPNDITTYVDPADEIEINITQPGHVFYPGAVVRYLHDVNGEWVITTIGVGNNPITGPINSALAPEIWEINTDQIALYSYADALMAKLAPTPTPSVPPVTPPSPITVSPPAGILVPPPPKALTYTYWNVGNGSWNNSANWTNGVPTATVEAIVTSSAPITITIDGVSVADYLELYHASSVTFQIETGTLGLETSSSIGQLAQSGGLVYLVSGTSSISAINQTGGIIYIASGELDADDGGSINGTISGSGTFVMKEGDFTLGSQAVISTPNWTVGTNSTLTLASNFAYAEDFTLSGDSIIYLNGYTLSLQGTGQLGGTVKSAATGNPAGTVLIGGTLSVNSLTLSGAVTLEDAKLVTQNGALTFSNGATAKIDQNATWNITANITDYAGESAPKGSIVNAGLFEKTGGTGTADISVATTNTGSILVTSGELEFIGGLNSTGTMTASGAILYVNNGLSGSGNIDIVNKGTAEFRTSVASSFNAVFEDATGTLQLDTPATFSGKIVGLQAGDFIDVTTGLTSESYANGVLTVSQTGFGVRGQLNIAGNFTTSSFHLSSDGHGGTNITV